MKKNAIWFLAVVIAALLAISLLWNHSMSAAGPAGQESKERAAARPAKENFDIRDARSKDAVSKYERRMRKFSSRKMAKNVRVRQMITGAREKKTLSVSGLDVTFSELTNSPQLIRIKSGGRRFLTRSSSQRRESVVRSFINDHSDLFGASPQQAQKRWKVAAEYANPNGRLSWLKMEQRWNGMKVFRGELQAAFTGGGELVQLAGELTGGIEEEELETTPKFSAAQAVVAAARSVDIELSENELTVKESSPDGRTIIFHPSGPFTADIKAELQYFPLDAGLATLAWSMVLWQDGPVYYTLVDAEEGDVLWRKNIVSHQTQPATYSVYNGDSPAPLSPTTALPGSGVQGAAIPRTTFTLISEGSFNNLGWLTDGVNTTTGNNVDAGLDLVAPNGIDPGGRPVGSPFRVFDFPYNPAPGIPPPGESPTLPDYRFGEVVNMFFWTNRYHDRLYELGFTEAAGNFQNDNFGRGGLGNDPVLAQAQDFGGTSNANFTTPPDGTPGQMQMFIFNGPDPDRSSGLDQEILIHELTHGLSNRLHNNASGLTSAMSRGMGEGWSDFYALSLLSESSDNPRGIYAMGGYSTFERNPGYTDNYYYGIRRFPYATISTVGPNGRPHNPLTFADIDPAQINLDDGAFPPGPIGSGSASEEHNIGEVWCSALWEVRARIIERMGFAGGNQRMLQLVTDGMKLDPPNPTFLDGRDSILTASCAAFGGQDELDIWAGFAARGMGVSARVLSSTSGSVIEAFDTPNLNLGGVTISNDSCAPADGFADPGETLTLTIPLTNPLCGTPANGVSISVAGGGQINYGNIGPGATVSMPASFTVPSAAVCGSQLPVNIVITSSLGTVTRTFNLQIGRPVVTLTKNYSSGNVAVPIPDSGSVDIPFNVTDIGAVADVNVKVRLNHTFVGDLVLSLIGPDGTSVPLSSNRGGAGDNFGVGANDCSGVPAVFDDSASTPISSGVAPFLGEFRPESPLSVFNGKSVTGAWILRVTDAGSLDTGTIGCVQLEIAYQRFACCGVPGVAELQAAAPAALVNESCIPGNGAPDPDETVTVNFPLMNIGTGNTTNLVATLLPGGGVLAPSGPQTYGVLVTGGPAVAKPFTFTVAGLCGGNLSATLALQDGAMNLGTVTFTMTIGGTVSATSSFSISDAITIPAPPSTGGAAEAPSTPYPSIINVSGVTGTVSKVTAEILDFNHTFPGDVDILLVGPGGQKILLMSDAGGGTDAVNADLTFDDTAAMIGPTVVSGTFRPTNTGAGDMFPDPAPAGPYPDPQQLSVFNGLNPNGMWRLYVVDDAASDTGSINGGWRLNITTTDPVCCNTPCTLTVPANIVVDQDPKMCGAVVNYPAPTFTGSCGVVTSDPPSGSSFPVGTTTVTVTGTRQDGTMTVKSFTVTVKPTTTATVGGPQTICELGTTAGLGGNTPANGTGAWSIVDGGTGTFSDPSAPNATFTHTGGTGPIRLRWTVSDGVCPPATADVIVNITPKPTTATAGPNQFIDSLGTTTGLGGNTPSVGTGTWTIESGGTGTFNPNANTPNATFTHTGGAGPIVLRWTIANEPCADSFADVTVTVKVPPLVNKTFGAPDVFVNQPTTMTITIQNPNATLALTGVAFTDNFPAGLVVGTPNGLSNTCGGTVTATAGSGQVKLTGGTVAANGSCAITVNVKGTTTGSKTNSTGSVTTNQTIPGTAASATLAVHQGSVTITDPAVCLGSGGVVSVTASATNNSGSSKSVQFTAKLPPQLVGVLGTCVSNIGSCQVNASTATWSGTLANNQTLTIQYQAQTSDSVTAGQQLCVDTEVSFNGGAPARITSCTTVTCPAIGPGEPYPAESAVSDQKAGSVLIYNIYTSSASDASAQNTRINLTNVDPKRSAFVHLFFVDGQTCSVADNYVCLTPNQTTTFLTSDVDPGTTGYLVAVAIDDKGCPTNFNNLVGDEYVKFASGHAANLGAEAIAALPGGLPRCDENSVKAEIKFDGVSYNPLPRVLALSNIPSRADGNDTMLILNRIGGDLTTSAAALTNVFGNFYDDTETSLSFSFNPRVCQLRSSITNSFPRIAPRFDLFVPAGRSGWLKLYSVEDQAILGAAINFNQNGGSSPGAFNQGHNLHKLTLTTGASYTIPVFPPSC